MEPFLSLVAEDLISRFGPDLSQVTVVFPSRRARLFFNNYLFSHAKVPVWAPRYLSIDELFEQASELRPADPIKLVCELYKIYIEVYNSYASIPSQETLDEFYFFGEILLKDFDDIDKNLANAKSLFSNLEDLDQLRDDFSHLNESQIEALIRYFKHAFQGETSLKTAFWSVWNILGKVYFSYKQKLKNEGISFPGMLMRSVIENEESMFPSEHYVFAGFNVLSKCEKELFKRLRDKASYYWDYDFYYLGDDDGFQTEAGRYIRQNLRTFKSPLPSENFDNLLSPDKTIKIIASASESGQSSYISPWIDSLNKPDFKDPDSVIVLSNENILPVVMHAIPPEKVRDVNVTMGFPINHSPICSFLQVLTEMQVKGYSESGKTFRYKYVLPVLRHPYTKAIFPEAQEVEETLIHNNIFFPAPDILRDKTLFSYAKTTEDLAAYLLKLIELVGKTYEGEEENMDIYNGLYQESVFRAYQAINRLYGLLQTKELEIEKTTFLRLMKKLFSSIKIPFHGEPVKGLQVMGVLETRALDFKNLIILSVNEGFMPGSDTDNTFIPQFLRKHFGLNTVDHQDSVYAYYFYRLIQRAENITLVYNTDKTQTGKAEISRFLLQMLVDPKITVERYSLQATIKPLQSQAIEVPKSEALIDKIKSAYDLNTNPEARSLSPSALNIFIDCSLRFYLQYIEGLQVKDELTDELDSSVFGTIFHRSAEMLYREIGGIKKDEMYFKPFLVKREYLDFYNKNQHRLNAIVSAAFSAEYFKGREINPKQYNGEQLINFRVIRHMLKRLIDFDARQTPFYIYGLERKVYANFGLNDDTILLKVGGIIDRLEEKDGAVRIVDYKTGGTAKPYKALKDLVIQKDTRASHIFQTFTYALVLEKDNQIEQKIVPSLIYMQDAGKENYSPVILYEKEDITDFRELSPVFEEVFKEKISELFNSEIPFTQTTASSKCTYCDFKDLCNR